MSEHYILNANGDAEPCGSLYEWAAWFETANRTLAKDQVGEALVSTVFLGLDHSFGGQVPVLWETMIFGGPHDQHQDRYSSREAALAGHASAVALCRSGPTPTASEAKRT